MAYKYGLMENIFVNTLLDVFVNFKGVDEIDGRWENTVTAKVNKYINANFGLSVLYEHFSDSRQIKESLAIGNILPFHLTPHSNPYWRRYVEGI